jgi:signal transduction histidine kinase/CheY-like chemotaxis protein
VSPEHLTNATAAERPNADRPIGLQRPTRILTSILDRMSDGVIVADEDGRVILSNAAAAQMLGIRISERLTTGWTAHHNFFLTDTVTPYPVDDFPLALALRGVAVKAVPVFVGESSSSPGGRWLSVDAMPLMDDDGVLQNGLAILRDVTAEKQAEAALLRAKDAAVAASRAKSQFLANMSHELRTPLNAIIGYSEMLQEQALDLGQEDSISDLRKIHAAGKHLQALINDILDLSKIEAGKMELFLERFDLAAMVRDVTATVQPLVRRNDNVLHVECTGDLGTMHGDLTKVRQVLFNLLSNAAKFSQQGTIRLEVLRSGAGEGASVQFCVADEGIGMGADQVARLFQDFTQVDASATRRFGGTGLGLAISRRFVEMMGGEIRVESEPGRGSVFTCRVPATLDAANGARADDVDVRPERRCDATVLVIDDDPDACQLMARQLTREGFHVVTALGGKEGLELARAFRPAVITLDVIMPAMDGWKVLTALKADAAVANIPVVIVSMTDDRRMGYALGACEYLTKPIDPAQLTALLHRHVPTATGGPLLVIDDDPIARTVTRHALARAGWEVEEAENGRVGLERIARRRPNLIVLDLMMPELDGFEFLNTLRRTPAWHDIPVVVVTGKDITPDERMRLDGVRGIVSKAAYPTSDLLAAVHDQIRRCLDLGTRDTVRT